MKILNLTLENFRGIKSLSIDFDGRDADIYGANSLGKTTIANAICWLLIDRPATEEANFDPKTTGAHGVHHTASIKVETNGGQEIIFSKDFYEKFTRKKGASTAELTGHNVDYFIDGVKSKQKEYNAAIERACGAPLDKLKMLLVLSYFTETMKTEEKRKILFELAGEFTDADVFAANEDLVGLMQYLAMPGDSNKNYTIDQWKQIAAEERKKLNKDLELLPARIDEVQKSIPESVEDEDALNAEFRRLEQRKEALEEEKRSLSTQDGQRDAVNAAIARLYTEIETKRAAYIKQGADANAETNNAIDGVRKELRGIEERREEFLRNKERRILKRGDLMEKREHLVKEYAETSKVEWDAGREICPTCGQTLPPERVQELRASFNQKKSEKLEAINRRGKETCSQSLIQQTESEIATLTENIKALDAEAGSARKRLQNLQDALTEQPPFETTEEYTLLMQRIEELEEKRKQGASMAGEVESTYAAKAKEIKDAMTDVTMRIARVRTAKESQSRIAELEQELKETAERMEHLEHGLHLCEEFTRTKARMVTESINKHFRRVRFILFRDQINGGLKEVCEPTGVNKDGQWVEYKSLNFAEQINSQLDIVNTLNKHYGTSLPVIMDKAESVTDPMPIDEQFIRLIVSAPDTDEFRIRMREKGAA